jgi:hypothetical protein
MKSISFTPVNELVTHPETLEARQTGINPAHAGKNQDKKD